MIRYTCRECGARLNSEAALAGRMSRCPVCGRQGAVPARGGLRPATLLFFFVAFAATVTGGVMIGVQLYRAGLHQPPPSETPVAQLPAQTPPETQAATSPASAPATTQPGAEEVAAAPPVAPPSAATLPTTAPAPTSQALPPKAIPDRPVANVAPATAPAVATAPVVAARPAPVVDDPRVRELIAAIEGGDAATALTVYNKGILTFPRNPDLARAFVRRMLQLGAPQMAANAAAVLTQVDPADASGWGVTGYVSAKKGDYPAALSALTRALALDPADVGTQANLGQLLAWHEAQKPAVALPEPARRVIDRTKEEWLKLPAFARGYAKLSAVAQARSQDQADYEGKLSAAQFDLLTLMQKANDLAGDYRQTLAQIEQHKRSRDALNPTDYDGSTFRALVRNENATIDLLKDQAQTTWEKGQLALTAVQAKQAEFDKLKTQSPKAGMAQAFLFDPPAVDGVVTLEPPRPATTAPARAADAEADARQGLELARLYMDNNMYTNAVATLTDVIGKFPQTKAAAEAKKLLADMGKQP
jgi:tetratricopeptide (TPR) repeat protein